MTVSYPGDPVIEPVGAGIGSLLVHRTARRLGLENREITILATGDDPAARYRQSAPNLCQAVLRSGVAPHFLAPDRSDAVLSPTQGAARIG